jgi:hypothetical protein
MLDRIPRCVALCAAAAAALASGGCAGSSGTEERTAGDGQGPSDIRSVPPYRPPEPEGGPDDDVEAKVRPVHPVPQLLSPADRRSFRALASDLGGEVGLVVGSPGGARQVLGGLRSGSAWSTIKVPMAIRTIEDAGGLDDLTFAERDDIDRALTRSDNAAAAELWESLKRRHGGAAGAAGAVEEVLERVGDERTVVSTRGRGSFSPYGQTEWSLPDQDEFMGMLAAGCSTSLAIARDVLARMADVVPEQRWGLGATGMNARFKGGWGPDPDGRYLVRQMGLLRYAPGRRRQVTVTIAARAADGSFPSATRMVTAVARWTAARVDPRAARRARCEDRQ